MIPQGKNIVQMLVRSSSPALKLKYLSTNTPNRDWTNIVEYEESPDVGLLIMNRAHRLNSCNAPMMLAMTTIVEQYEKANKSLVIIKSSSPKAFSTGADLTLMTQLAKEGDKVAMLQPVRCAFDYLYTSKRLKVPAVSLTNGLTIGGGLGVAAYCKHFICTENTLTKLPEVGIGHFVDAGMSHVLARLKNHLGFYLSLTMAQLNGYDNVHAGMATHFCPAEKLAELEKSLWENPREADAVLESFSVRPGNSKFSLEPYLEKIDSIFSSKTVEEIIAKLEEDGSEWAKKTIATLRRACPLSVKVTLRQLQISKTSTIEESFQNDYILSNTFVGGENLFEGVRAYLLDKDNKPKWVPETLEDVTPQMVDALYKVKPFLGPLQLRSTS